MITVRDIEQGARGTVVADAGAGLDEPIHAVTIDSRLVKEGDLFVALPGQRVDGHDFISDAVRAGARAVLLSRTPQEGPPPGVAFVHAPDTLRALGDLAAYWRRKMPARVHGITGSVGKTSTKEALASILGARFKTMRSERNLNNEIGLPLALLALTPDVEVAVLEMGGAYAMGEIEFLCSLAQPQVGIVTNVGHSHLERMGTIERIAETKSELVACLPPDGVAVLNRDDPFVRGMAARARCPVVWYGLDPGADVRADEVESAGLSGVSFRIHIEGGAISVKSPLPGRHSVHTVLAAAAAAHAEGMTPAEIAAAVKRLPGNLRLVVAPGINGSTLLDDTYNASPASTLAALNLLAEVPGRKVAVLGDMAELGAYTEEGHSLVGARAGAVCDLLYTIGPLSRSTARAAISAGLSPAAARQFGTGNEALPALARELREGDTVLIKGSRAMALDTLAAALALPGTGEK